jgi:MFS transporter, PAT family, beta-lactamase induction signal transducer AmpG
VKASKAMRYGTYALIYFAEGAIVSYFTALNPLYLRSFGLTMSSIGLIGTLALIPFVLKIFLGMLSDRFNFFGFGYRKPYILIGLILQAACLLIVPQINPYRQFGWFAFLAFVLMTGQALYDTTTDGLALDTTRPDEQGTIQGFMVGGRALGVVLISSIVGILAQRVSFAAVFYTLALLTLLPLPLAWLAKESPRPPERKFSWKAFSVLKSPGILSLALLGALYSLVINGATEILNPFLEHTFAIRLDSAGYYTSVWGIGVVIGGLTGGRLVDRIGQPRSVTWAAIITAVTIPLLGLIPSPAWAWILVALFGLAYGYYETVYFAISMQRSDPRIAASMFSILMAIANLGTAVGLSLAGGLVDRLGYLWTFVILGGLSLLSFLLLPLVFNRQTENK